MKKNSIVCLFSGGIDSTVLLKHYLDKNLDVQGLFFDYGQPTALEELAHVYRISKKLGVHVERAEVKDLVSDNSYFYPMRNAIFLACAINLAYGLKIPNVAIGCNLGEFLDQRPEFIDRFNFMQQYCLKNPIWVDAPFANWSSEKVIKHGIKIGAPLNLTISCVSIRACGTCLKCRLRKKYGIDK